MCCYDERQNKCCSMSTTRLKLLDIFCAKLLLGYPCAFSSITITSRFQARSKSALSYHRIEIRGYARNAAQGVPTNCPLICGSPMDDTDINDPVRRQGVKHHSSGFAMRIQGTTYKPAARRTTAHQLPKYLDCRDNLRIREVRR